MASYRIVRDDYLGYEVQIRRWWWPFWSEADFCNTHHSIEHAEKWAAKHAQGVVKHLGRYVPDELEPPKQTATVLRLVARSPQEGAVPHE